MKNAIRAFVMLLSAPLSAYAQSTTNSIYVDQVGDASTITITQKGQNNSIGTEQNRFQIAGGSQQMEVTQQGNNNSINGKIVQADNIDYTVTATGDSNAMTFDQGDATSVSGSKLVLGVEGNSNIVSLTQGSVASSTNADQEITIAGDQNSYTSTINADDVKNRITIAGDQNLFVMTQNGHHSKEVTSSVTGNGNTITIDQTSTLNVDKINITHIGNGNTIAIAQCNSGGGC